MVGVTKYEKWYVPHMFMYPEDTGGDTNIVNVAYRPESNGDVDVTMDLDSHHIIDSNSFDVYTWTMKLMRENYNGGWDVIGTRTGWISTSSPSNRTFTSVRASTYPLKIQVIFRQDFPRRYSDDFITHITSTNEFYMA